MADTSNQIADDLELVRELREEAETDRASGIPEHAEWCDRIADRIEALTETPRPASPQEPKCEGCGYPRSACTEARRKKGLGPYEPASSEGAE